jgi:hypothetical protein
MERHLFLQAHPLPSTSALLHSRHPILCAEAYPRVRAAVDAGGLWERGDCGRRDLPNGDCPPAGGGAPHLERCVPLAIAGAPLVWRPRVRSPVGCVSSLTGAPCCRQLTGAGWIGTGGVREAQQDGGQDCALLQRCGVLPYNLPEGQLSGLRDTPQKEGSIFP